MTEHDRKLLDEWQMTTEGVTERRLRDFTCALDDLRSLASRREGAHILRASRQDLKSAMLSLVDLYQDLSFDDERSPVVHLSDLRELRRAANA
jgi:hypothetical protein